jgi:hypothetical protein
MDDPDRRHALERRIWRLAYLLTGDAAGAAGLVDRILDAQEDPARLDPAHLDRLVIQQAREMIGTRGPRERPLLKPGSEPLATRALAAARSMPAQPREAWLLARIDIVDELWMSRAMDCSRTAARHHLESGENQMRALLMDSYDKAVLAVREFADTLDPGPIIEAHRTVRRKTRLRRRMAIGVGIGVGVLGTVLVLLRSGLI